MTTANVVAGGCLAWAFTVDVMAVACCGMACYVSSAYGAPSENPDLLQCVFAVTGMLAVEVCDIGLFLCWCGGEWMGGFASIVWGIVACAAVVVTTVLATTGWARLRCMRKPANAQYSQTL